MSRTKQLKIMIADDHDLVRAGFRALLEKVGLVREISEAGNGLEAIQKAKLFQPDIILMDISMPELNGLETTEIIHKQFPEINIIILSMYAEEDYVHKALEVGSRGYLLKDASSEELEEAIQIVSKGNVYLCPRLGELTETKTNQDLTIRQREILQLIAEGKNAKEIGRILNISSKTVDAHRYNIMARLNINDLASLVRYAIRIGLIQEN